MSVSHPNINFATQSINPRIIIEGCDGVGKDTFIRYFIAYIRGEGLDGIQALDLFKGANFKFANVDEHGSVVVKRTGQVISEPTVAQYEHMKRYPKRYHHNPQLLVPKWGNMYSVTSVHSRDSSPEGAAFCRGLDSGEITDQNYIATEYLQVHYDLERLCRELDKIFSIIIMNRSLVSYYAMQITALDMQEHAENWGKLWRWAYQRTGIFVHLTLPEDKLRERLRARQGDDFRGEVEDFYMARSAAIERGFNTLKTDDGWMATLTINADKKPEDFAEDFEQILQFRTSSQVKAEALG